MTSFAMTEWNADGTRDKLRSAARDAIDETMGRAVNRAKQTVRKRTTALQGSIKFEAATIKNDSVTGRWGSFDINYAIYQEIGPVTGKRNWSYTPYLRPSAEAEYPDLVSRIRERYGR